MTGPAAPAAPVVAIVGGGLSGAAVALHLAERIVADRGAEVTVKRATIKGHSTGLAACG